MLEKHLEEFLNFKVSTLDTRYLTKVEECAPHNIKLQDYALYVSNEKVNAILKALSKAYPNDAQLYSSLIGDADIHYVVKLLKKILKSEGISLTKYMVDTLGMDNILKDVELNGFSEVSFREPKRGGSIDYSIVESPSKGENKTHNYSPVMAGEIPSDEDDAGDFDVSTISSLSDPVSVAEPAVPVYSGSFNNEHLDKPNSFGIPVEETEEELNTIDEPDIFVTHEQQERVVEREHMKEIYKVEEIENVAKSVNRLIDGNTSVKEVEQQLDALDRIICPMEDITEEDIAKLIDMFYSADPSEIKASLENKLVEAQDNGDIITLLKVLTLI